jgi:hypothetical protein
VAPLEGFGLLEARRVLRKIARDVGMTVEEFLGRRRARPNG